LTAPAKVPPGSTDDLEFLLRPADKIVLYRSATRDTVLVYPFQQYLPEQGQTAGRLETIRDSLGWDILKQRDKTSLTAEEKLRFLLF